MYLKSSIKISESPSVVFSFDFVQFQRNIELFYLVFLFETLNICLLVHCNRNSTCLFIGGLKKEFRQTQVKFTCLKSTTETLRQRRFVFFYVYIFRNSSVSKFQEFKFFSKISKQKIHNNYFRKCPRWLHLIILWILKLRQPILRNVVCFSVNYLSNILISWVNLNST